MPFLAFLLLLAGAVAAGRCCTCFLVGPTDSRLFAAVLHLTAGLLLVHAALAWLDLAGLAWHPLVIVVVVAAVALAVRWSGRARRTLLAPGTAKASGGAAPRLGWAGCVGASIVGYFAVLAASERIAFPDFVYHWGIKGHRYFLGRGIDYEFLAAEWNLVAHRDYPQLVPELYALQSMFAGRFSEPVLLLWSAVFFAALLVAAREGLAAWRVGEDAARITFVLLALAVGVFAVGHQMAGSVDWIVAFALAAAIPALARPVSAQGELQLGLLAALAASSKLEGIPLAVLLVAAGFWRRVRGGSAGNRDAQAAVARTDLAGATVVGAERDLRSMAGALATAAARLVVPSVIAVTPWVVQGLRHDLFRDPQSGGFEIGRAPGIAAAVWRAMLQPEWHFAPFVLLLLPLLFVRAQTRLVGAVVALQLGGYLLRYFTAAFDYEFSVLSSFPRLLFHVLPAVVVGLAVLSPPDALRAEAGSAPTAEPSSAPTAEP